jgi:hypothetical protein
MQAEGGRRTSEWRRPSGEGRQASGQRRTASGGGARGDQRQRLGNVVAARPGEPNTRWPRLIKVRMCGSRTAAVLRSPAQRNRHQRPGDRAGLVQRDQRLRIARALVPLVDLQAGLGTRTRLRSSRDGRAPPQPDTRRRLALGRPTVTVAPAARARCARITCGPIGPTPKTIALSPGRGCASFTARTAPAIGSTRASRSIGRAVGQHVQRLRLGRCAGRVGPDPRRRLGPWPAPHHPAWERGIYSEDGT